MCSKLLNFIHSGLSLRAGGPGNSYALNTQLLKTAASHHSSLLKGFHLRKIPYGFVVFFPAN